MRETIKPKVILRLTVTLCLIALLIHRVDGTQVLDALRTANLMGVLLALFVLVVCVTALSSFQLKLLLERHHGKLPFLQVWRYDLISRFYGVFAPGLGGAARWYLFRKLLSDGAGPLSALLFNRLAQTVTLFGVGLLCWFGGSANSALDPKLLLAGFAAVVSAYGIVLLPLTLRLCKVLIKRLLPERFQERAQRITSAVDVMREAGPTFHLGLICLAFTRQLMAILGIFLMSEALDLGVKYLVFGWIRAVEVVVVSFPVSFGGAGLREMTFLTLLSRLGVTPGGALALGVLLTLAQLTLSLVGGAVEFRLQAYRPEDK